MFLGCFKGGDSASWSRTRRVGSQSWSRVRDWTRRVQVWTRRVDAVQQKTLAVSYWVVFKGCMSSFHVFWPIVENPRRLWHLEQNLKAIIDFEGIVVQEEGGFWPKEEQGVEF